MKLDRALLATSTIQVITFAWKRAHTVPNAHYFTRWWFEAPENIVQLDHFPEDSTVEKKTWNKQTCRFMTTFRTVFNRWGSVKKKLFHATHISHQTGSSENHHLQKVTSSSCHASAQEVVVSHVNVVTFTVGVCDISIKSMSPPDHLGWFLWQISGRYTIGSYWDVPGSW